MTGTVLETINSQCQSTLRTTKLKNTKGTVYVTIGGAKLFTRVKLS